MAETNPTAPNPTPQTPPATPPQAPPADPKHPTPPAPDPKAEVERLATEKAQAIVAAEREKDRQRIEREKAKAEEDAAKEQGKFKELHEKAQARAEAAERERDAARRSEQVNDALVDAAASHEGYSVAALKKHLKPAIVAAIADDAKPEDIAAAVKEAVAQFVKDFPVAPKGGAGAPVVASARTIPATATPLKAPESNGRTRLSRVTSGF